MSRVIDNNVQGTIRDALRTFTVNVGAAATIVPIQSGQRTAIEVFNDSGSTVYVGGSAVTTADGRPIANGTGYSMNVEASCAVYLIWAGPGVAVVRVIEGA